jgi:predicted RNA-binding protein with PIN domain
MALVIDGHNLIGAMPDIHLSEPDDEARLLARLRSYRAHNGQSLIVFFDSGDLPASTPSMSSPGVMVRYSAPGQTADDAIVDFLRTRDQPGQYAVVTNDADLAWRVRSAGASVMRASDFMAKITRPPARPRNEPAEPAPDPRDPAFADIYTGFIAAERSRSSAGKATLVSRQTWIERLYGDDIDAAQKAARWLGLNGGKEALTPLRDALTHSDVRVRAAALLAFGDAGDPGVLPDLCARLAHDQGSMAREAAAQSLGRIGDRHAESALEAAARSDPKSKVRKAARAALGQIKARRK